MTISLKNSPTKWIEIRDHVGKLLFKYNPWDNIIELRRGSMVYDLIRLEEIRARFGVREEIAQVPPAAVVTILPIDN